MTRRGASTLLRASVAFSKRRGRIGHTMSAAATTYAASSGCRRFSTHIQVRSSCASQAWARFVLVRPGMGSERPVMDELKDSTKLRTVRSWRWTDRTPGTARTIALTVVLLTLVAIPVLVSRAHDACFAAPLGVIARPSRFAHDAVLNLSARVICNIIYV